MDTASGNTWELPSAMLLRAVSMLLGGDVRACLSAVQLWSSPPFTDRGLGLRLRGMRGEQEGLARARDMAGAGAGAGAGLDTEDMDVKMNGHSGMNGKGLGNGHGHVGALNDVTRCTPNILPQLQDHELMDGEQRLIQVHLPWMGGADADAGAGALEADAIASRRTMPLVCRMSVRRSDVDSRDECMSIHGIARQLSLPMGPGAYVEASGAGVEREE